MQVGVIGLGNIGGHVATNLVTDGHDVVVYDVDAERAASIDGARAVTSVADVGAVSEVTVLSLPTPAVVRAVADEWASTAPAGAVLVDLSTNSPEVVRELGARLTATSHHLVEAPLTGGAIGAQNRMLSFMVGGDDDAVARVQPVLEPLGRAFVHLGALGLGNTMKLVNSLIAFTTTWVSLEGLSIAAKSGVPVQQAVQVLRTNGVANFYLDRMVENIDTRNAPTQFALGLAAKDAGLIVETGRALGVPTPAGAAVLQVLVGAIAGGLGDHDWGDLVAAAERQGDVELHWNTPTGQNRRQQMGSEPTLVTPVRYSSVRRTSAAARRALTAVGTPA